MPVEDLIRYFNLADRSGEGTLYPIGERVEAWTAGFHLGSLFRPIVALANQQVVGHQALLAVRREDGTPATSEQVYKLCESQQSVVYLDRLCRTLHALNFLDQRRHTGGYLQLSVHPRHLQAVPSQHGLVYEAILKRCGLAPEDIILEISRHDVDEQQHFAHALAAYRQRGYRLAIQLPADGSLHDSLLALRQDILRLPERSPKAAYSARQVGIQVEQNQIEDTAALRAAYADGIDLAQGQLFGEPATECSPTHKSATTPKIDASRSELPHENRQ
jgi:EAL domain-containing protein (putative c-di-GMP-specific phosphodiesterase class I)